MKDWLGYLWKAQLSPFTEDHSQHARLTLIEKNTFINLSKSGVKPKTTLSTLKYQNLENASSLQTLYNVKKKIIKED